jgi:hypothetical protein
LAASPLKKKTTNDFVVIALRKHFEGTPEAGICTVNFNVPPWLAYFGAQRNEIQKEVDIKQVDRVYIYALQKRIAWGRGILVSRVGRKYNTNITPLRRCSVRSQRVGLAYHRVVHCTPDSEGIQLTFQAYRKSIEVRNEGMGDSLRPIHPRANPAIHDEPTIV